MQTPEVRYALEPDGSFVVENYNWADPFSNFFPGIAGAWGVPLWAYWVNRHQAVTSLGYRDKDGQILEFQSFNKACLTVATEGFRTFLRLDGALYEPFARTRDPAVRQILKMWPGELELLETHAGLGLEVWVRYGMLADRPVGAFVREIRVRDTSGRPRRLEWADGAARVLPAGVDQQHVKFVARHVEAMMGVARVDGVPLFRLKQSAADVERIEALEGGTFVLPLDGVRPLGEAVVHDPDVLFGESLTLDTPWVFADEGAEGVRARPQHGDCKTPCAFTLRDETLPAHGEVGLVTLLGHAERDEEVRRLLAWAAEPDFLEGTRERGRRLLDAVMDRSFTVSADRRFDAYVRQNFLDNVMRGGMPLVRKTADGKSAFYVFSRQNGDLERDYHFFVLEPGWLSQGTGHYRSVLQNRRLDGWFFPEVEDLNLRTFLDLAQLDGYNPLEVGRLTYRIADADGLAAWLAEVVPEPEARPPLLELARRDFTPGAFLMALDRAAGGLPDREAAFARLLSLSTENEVGGLHEGFWVDHWTYVLDLVDTYLALWPDRREALFLGRPTYRFFDDPDVILPRAEKQVRVGDAVRRYGAVVRDDEKVRRIAGRTVLPYAVRTGHGEGEVYRTTLLVKLLVLLANRVATLDPSGLGMDMEADKPGWNDSMNGLPGLFGSGLSETLELLRLARLVEAGLEGLEGEVRIFEELATLMDGLAAALDERLARPGAEGALAFWRVSNELKERYRAQTRHGVDGAERVLTVADARAFAGKVRGLLEGLFADAEPVRDPTGVPYTYFVHRAVDARDTGRTSHQGLPLVAVDGFERRPVRRFLEGPVHWMKVRPEEAPEVYRAVRESPLYDRALGMYRSCEDMRGEDPELGRAVGAYPRGWIENESIYLHMEYKYLLEILRSGLTGAFWEDARSALVCFQPPERYKRSILEGASFVVSSAFADPAHHGQAFQPRLSGITCEMIHMWTLMTAGPRPLRVEDDGRLALVLEPRLPGWLFTEQETSRTWVDEAGTVHTLTVGPEAFAFRLFGSAMVVYESPGRRDTFGEGAPRPTRFQVTWADGRTEAFEGDRLVGAPVEDLRAGRVSRIDVQLASP